MAAGRGDVDAKSLNVQGGTQPDYYPDTVSDMVAEIRADPAGFGAAPDKPTARSKSG